MNEIIDALKKFRDERDWQQFHNPKDLSLALSIEAASAWGFDVFKNRGQSKFNWGLVF